MKGDAYLAINPMGKVPAIRHIGADRRRFRHDRIPMADAFPEAGLAPPPAERGAYYRWLFFVAGPLEAAVLEKALGFEPPADKRMAVGYGSFDEAISTLEKAVQGRDYIAGDRFSAADLYAASHLGWGMDFGTIPKRPAFEAYVQRHFDRPAHKRATEIDDALMPAR
jgi:glutathione S-transferase